MSEEWRESDGRNVYQMILDAAGPGIWVRRTTWDASIAHIVGMSEPAGPPPYFGSPKVVMDVYSLQGARKDNLAKLDTAGTFKTWRQVPPPEWANGPSVRSLEDPAIARTLEALTRKGGGAARPRVEMNVPYARKDEAKALGARWDGARKTWWLPAEGTNAAQEKARKLGFLP